MSNRENEAWDSSKQEALYNCTSFTHMKPSLSLHVICKIPLIWPLILFLSLYLSFPDILCHRHTRLCQLLCPKVFSLLITFTHFSLLIFPASSPVKLCISSRSWLVFHFPWETSCESLYQVRVPLLYVHRAPCNLTHNLSSLEITCFCLI